MENRRKIWRKFVEYTSSLWCSYPFGLCVLILNWSNNRKYVLGKDWLCSSKKNGSGFEKICHRFKGNTSPTLRKSDTDFREICHRLWGNPSPILRKPVTDFGEIRYRFWGNPSPILGKSATDFGEICHRFWGNLPPILWKISHLALYINNVICCDLNFWFFFKSGPCDGTFCPSTALRFGIFERLRIHRFSLHFSMFKTWGVSDAIDNFGSYIWIQNSTALQ